MKTLNASLVGIICLTVFYGVWQAADSVSAVTQTMAEANPVPQNEEPADEVAVETNGSYIGKKEFPGTGHWDLIFCIKEVGYYEIDLVIDDEAAEIRKIYTGKLWVRGVKNSKLVHNPDTEVPGVKSEGLKLKLIQPDSTEDDRDILLVLITFRVAPEEVVDLVSLEKMPDPDLDRKIPARQIKDLILAQAK